MGKKQFRCGMLAMVLSLGIASIGCNGDDGNGFSPIPPVQRDPITGTVTVSSEVTVSVDIEQKRLIANVSGSNATNFTFEWMVDGSNSGFFGSTFFLRDSDIGRNISVRVTSPTHSGQITSTPTAYTPTTMTLTLRRHATIWGRNTGIVITREDGTPWLSVASTPTPFGNLTTAGTTVTLTSWVETSFRMRTQYTMLFTEFFFTSGSVDGSESFPFASGARTYTLQKNDDPAWGLLWNLVAIEG